MDTNVLEKLAVDTENIEWGRCIINKDDINIVNVVKANKSHIMRCDKLAVTMGVTDINQISIANEIMNPFIIEEGTSYVAPGGNSSLYYDSTEPSYPVTSSTTLSNSLNNDDTDSTNINNTDKLSTDELTAILEPVIDSNRLK